MNWIDWIILAIFVGATLWGYRTGLVTTVLTVAALYVAMLLSAQFADSVVGMFTDSVESEALSKAIGYVVIFVGVFIAAKLAATALRTTITMLFLGWADKLGGLVAGLAVGVLVSGAMVAALARFAYVFDPATDGGGAIEHAASALLDSSPREAVDGWLVESTFTEALLDLRGIVPVQTLGLTPGDFDTALDILETRIADNAGAT